jgi:hypothetical protein
MKLRLKYRSLLLLAISFVILSISCSKDHGDYYNYTNKDAFFDGTIKDYLTQANSGRFDSMVALLNKVNLLDTLNSTDSITVIGFTNTSFDNAMTNLNALRKSLNKPLLSIATLDSAGVDTLICKYIIPQYLPVDSVKEYTDGRTVGILHYPDYTMNLEYSKRAAEGLQNEGPQLLTINDMKHSSNNSAWIGNITQAVDIKTKNGILHILEDGHEFGFSDASKVLNKD